MRSILQVEQKELEDSGEVLCLSKKDALAHELASERARAKHILDKVMNHWGVSDAYTEMRKGCYRDPGPLKNLDCIDMK